MNKRTFREGDLVYVQKTYWFISTLDNISVDFINEDRLTLVEKGTKVAINTGIV